MLAPRITSVSLWLGELAGSRFLMGQVGAGVPLGVEFFEFGDFFRHFVGEVVEFGAVVGEVVELPRGFGFRDQFPVAAADSLALGVGPENGGAGFGVGGFVC